MEAEISSPTGRKTTDSQPAFSHFTDWTSSAQKAKNILIISKCQRNFSLFTLIFLHINSSKKKLFWHLKSYCCCKKCRLFERCNITQNFIFFYLLGKDLPTFFYFEERPIILVLSAEPHKNVNFLTGI